MNKLLINLIKPYKIPSKIIRKIKFLINKRRYNQNEYEKKQNNLFESIGLDRNLGIEKLILIKKKFNLNVKRSMSSEHEILFSSISINENMKITNILEIGTFDGFNALLLSKLFPGTQIHTIDLPNNDNDLRNTYERKNSIKDFLNERDKIISNSKNINFKQLNSVKLINHNKKYDLIWIDGAHGYPIVCIDIVNSLNLINDKGIILCDDIFLNLKLSKSDKMYNSLASYETLRMLEEQKLIKLELIYKRLNSKDNCLENERKYIAIINKN